MRHHRKTLPIALATVLSALSLGGCLFNRVVEVRDQFCAFDANFTVDLAEGAVLDIHHPVLLDSDIIWLAGSQPTSTTHSGERLSMHYAIEKVGDPKPADPDLWVDLDFNRSGDQYKLTGVRFDPRLKTLLGPEYLDDALIESAAQTVCETGRGWLSSTVELDIGEEELALLPTRREVIDWLGAPLHQDPADNRLSYAYRLKNDDPDPLTAHVSVWYDEAGIRPLRMESRYSRFRTEADFEARKVTMKIDL